MTADQRLTRHALVNVVIHVSQIVCLEPRWTLPAPPPPRPHTGVALVPPLHRPTKPPECARPDTVEPGL